MNDLTKQAFRNMLRSSIVLGGFSILTMGMVTWVYWCIYERIASEKQQYEKSILEEMLPRNSYDNNLLDDYVMLQSSQLLATEKMTKAFIARYREEITAIILPVFAPDGYSSSIELLVAINIQGEILGVRVLKHGETPGLGDKILLTATDWLLRFNGKSLTNPAEKGWRVKKDGGEFDQFTGVTVTPRAVVAAVSRALQFFNVHKDTIFPMENLKWQ